MASAANFPPAEQAEHLPPAMTRAKKQKLYKGCPVGLHQIQSWDGDANYRKVASCHAINQEMNKKISVYQGDITQLEIDAIVNAANHHLRGGSGVDGAIHKAAGPDLLAENMVLLQSCPVGQARVAAGYKLPAWYVIHTNGPQYKKDPVNAPSNLVSCYENCLAEVDRIIFCVFDNTSLQVYYDTVSKYFPKC